ncbi:putative mucin TcMUCII [Trypanosoma cruzi]|nr:putative mucin TcMUCII [Trypanosoma cruzi]
MMTTCRLLCALLVLALCCCPSVCVTTNEAEGEDDSTTDSHTQKDVSRTNGKQKGTSGSPDLTNKESEDESENGTQEIQGRPTDGISNSEGASGASGEPGKTSSVDQSATNPKLEVPVEKRTTTTTTKAPITTTATTTTTTAPEAPSTTVMNTETPTTTTTRAPSRLREIDGSLSSSAWVCAPLLLAVSTLAYTTLG